MTNTVDTKNGAVEAAEAVTERAFQKPQYTAESREHGYSLRVLVPGVDKTGVSIAVEEEVLTVTANRQSPIPESWRPVVEELSKRDYRLQLRLDIKIDPERITARLENGVLEVTLPLKETAKPRTIAIS